MSPGERLISLASLFSTKNAEYGDNYKRFGDALHALFPQGITLDTPEKFNRFTNFVQLVHKLFRYSQNFDKGHGDSLDDLAVYAMLLRTYDDEMLDLRHRNNGSDT